jgi:uncharacterized damage-inducible protein DinB
MITPEFARTMAAYNSWQNRSLYAAAAGLDDAARRQDRGAFFGSIHGTLSHLLWADQRWMHRFAGWEDLPVAIEDSAAWQPDFDRLHAARGEADAGIAAWAQALDAGWLAGDLTWFSGVSRREMRKPRALLVAHMFNHQTHHRGQVHAMLTAAGARPEPTDLPWMPAA